jgi:chemotaxis methyl-accepting protein methylase
MKQIIKNYLNINKGKRLNILNVGCGGSRELREIPIHNKGEGLTIYLMDFDTDATSFSIRYIRDNAAKADLVPLNVDVRDLGNKKKSDNLKINKYDFVYSIGLLDYLSDKIIINLLNKLLTAMKDDGLLVVAHKDFKQFDPAISDWFCDWKYFSRTQSDFEELINKLDTKPKSVTFSREKDGYIYFASIQK